MLAGRFTGKVKALFNERDQKVNNIPPSTPVTLLGLNGAPQAGDVFYVRKDEKEAKSIAANMKIEGCSNIQIGGIQNHIKALKNQDYILNTSISDMQILPHN